MAHFLEPAKECIYCGARSLPLTDEHVIPYALDGRWILPQASCKRCQEYINKRVEGNLLSNTLKTYRQKYGYRSRSKHKTPDGKTTLSHWPITIRRNVPPFQTVKMEPVQNVTLPELRFNMPLPYFLRLVEYKSRPSVKIADIYGHENVQTTRMNRYSKTAHLAKNYRDNNAAYLVKKYGEAGVITSIEVSFPRIVIGQFERQLLKIACGFLFASQREAYQASGVRVLLFSEEKTMDYRYCVFACPRKYFDIGKENAVIVFGVCENGRHSYYCAMNIMERFLANTYFVRIVAPDHAAGFWTTFPR